MDNTVVPEYVEPGAMSMCMIKYINLIGQLPENTFILPSTIKFDKEYSTPLDLIPDNSPMYSDYKYAADALNRKSHNINYLNLLIVCLRYYKLWLDCYNVNGVCEHHKVLCPDNILLIVKTIYTDNISAYMLCDLLCRLPIDWLQEGEWSKIEYANMSNLAYILGAIRKCVEKNEANESIDKSRSRCSTM